MSIERPKPFVSKWAESGEKWDLPESGASHKDGRADIQTGFPKQTMISVLNGGVPPYGRDHNTILNRITQDLQWTQAGGLPVFDEALCNKIGGYPVGTILQHSVSDSQVTDPDKPWVLWLNLKDGNSSNPDLNKVDDFNTQNGWVRYPSLSLQAGSMLQYDKEGRLFVPSPAAVTEVHVDSDNGDDITNDGSIDSPYRSIYRAIISTTDYTSVSIHLKAYVTNPYYYAYNSHEGHGHVKLDGNGDPVWDYVSKQVKKDESGNIVLDENGNQVYEYKPLPSYGDSIWTDKNDLGGVTSVQSLSVGARRVSIDTYGDQFFDKAAQVYRAIGSSVNVSTFKGITRPIIVGFWRVRMGAVNYLSFQGNEGDSQISFTRVQIALHDVDKLANTPEAALVGFFWSGSKYSFNGVIFHKLPSGNNHYLGDGGGAGRSYYDIGYCRFESFDESGNFIGKFLHGGGATQITLADDVAVDVDGKGVADQKYKDANGVEHPYEYIDMNQHALLTRVEAYQNIEVIYNPSKSYQGLITNFEIKGVKDS